MTVSSMNARQLVIEVPLPPAGEHGQVPVTGVLSHPLPDGANVCEVIRGLALVAPNSATWYVRPPRGS